MADMLRFTAWSSSAALASVQGDVRALVRFLADLHHDGGKATWPVQPSAGNLAAKLLGATDGALVIYVQQAVQATVAECEALGGGSLQPDAARWGNVSLALELLQVALLCPMWDICVCHSGSTSGGGDGAAEWMARKLLTMNGALDALSFLTDRQILPSVVRGVIGSDGAANNGVDALLLLLLLLADRARQAGDTGAALELKEKLVS